MNPLQNPVQNNGMAFSSSEQIPGFSADFSRIIQQDLVCRNTMVTTYENGEQLIQKSISFTRKKLDGYVERNGYKLTLSLIKNSFLELEKKQLLYYAFFSIGGDKMQVPCHPNAQNIEILTRSPFLQCLKDELANIPRSDISRCALNCLISGILHNICTINSDDISTDDDEGPSFIIPFNIPFQKEAIPYFFSIFPPNFTFDEDVFLFNSFVCYFAKTLKHYEDITFLPEILQKAVLKPELSS